MPHYQADSRKLFEVTEQFTYHPPQGDQLDRYQQLRDAGKNLALLILELTPPSADQSAAIRLLREAIMTSNAAIALENTVGQR